jgi:hypothetical protein
LVSSWRGRGTSEASKYIERWPSHCRPLGKREERREERKGVAIIAPALSATVLLVSSCSCCITYSTATSTSATSTAATVCLSVSILSASSYHPAGSYHTIPYHTFLRLIYDPLCLICLPYLRAITSCCVDPSDPRSCLSRPRHFPEPVLQRSGRAPYQVLVSPHAPRYHDPRSTEQHHHTAHRSCDPPVDSLLGSGRQLALCFREKALLHSYGLALHYQKPASHGPVRLAARPLPRCVIILRSSTSVATSGLSSGLGVRITKRHIVAARRLWWLLSSGTCKNPFIF